ncbi:hypothetical protein HYH03_003091 [Edaphochlamys debaryana]|uniref:Uncharacterized protein n=1 Tax=Edaphochlamys debaryana TaxID=47281 RepID=A0A835Y9N2_9CHLO|nr:hypothetical protein HYH03_003091 [Edaphochlamys debaryana]|eukprot:KAG2498900.1 hypothetical protein HYH03_003091 [Edaphochlamys debaryana]
MGAGGAAEVPYVLASSSPQRMERVDDHESLKVGERLKELTGAMSALDEQFELAWGRELPAASSSLWRGRWKVQLEKRCRPPDLAG